MEGKMTAIDLTELVDKQLVRAAKGTEEAEQFAESGKLRAGLIRSAERSRKRTVETKNNWGE